MSSETDTASVAGKAFSDRDLVAQAQAGDRQAFNRLILAYQHQIVGLCVRQLGSRQEGEDAAQEAFVKAYQGLNKFKGDSQFSTWLYRIAVNSCRNRQRSWWGRLRRRAVRLDNPAGGDGDGPVRELGDTRNSPEKDLKRSRIRAAVQAALATLPEIHRELIILRDIQDKTYEEIEQIVGVSLGTVKSRLARAREAMRRELEGAVDDV